MKRGNVTDLIGTVLDDKYELTRLLGEGGMGAVYEAKHKLVNKRVAVKLLHPQFSEREDVVKRFHREAQAAAAIGHENIADAVDMGKTPSGAPYLVMEYLDGSDLKHLLKKTDSLSLPSIAHIMVQVLEALQAAHAANIIHRDLKPENIFLIKKRDNPLYVKVLDFGISKFKDLKNLGGKETTGLTQTGMVMGTPHYMSPEQASGDKAVDHRTDIYAMGVILYEMCTNSLPYIATTYNALIVKLFTESPPDPTTFNPDLPPDLVDVIKTAMAREPDARFPDCEAFRERLLSYLPEGSRVPGFLATETSISKPRVSKSKKTAPTPMAAAGSAPGVSRKYGKGKIVALVAFLAAGILAAVYFVFSSPSPETPAPKPQSPAIESTTLASKPQPSDVESTPASKPQPSDVESTPASKPQPSDVESTPASKPQPSDVKSTPAPKPQPSDVKSTPAPAVTAAPPKASGQQIAAQSPVLKAVKPNTGTPSTAADACIKPTAVSGAGSGSCAGQLPGEHMQWSGVKAPMFADINKDGIKDIVAWIRFLNVNDGSLFEHIGAFNTLTGERFWKTGPLAGIADMMNVRAAVAEGRLLVADAAGTLKAFSLNRGRMMWSGMLGERADRICKDDKGFARIETTDKRVVRVRLATGQITPVGTVDIKNPCRPFHEPTLDTDGFVIGGGSWNKNGITNPRIEGMTVNMVVLEKRSKAAVAIGRKSPGTAVPMAARYDSTMLGKKRGLVIPLWRTLIPTVPPFTVKEGAPEAAAVSNGLLFTSYALQNAKKGARLAALEIATGTNRWDTPIPFSTSGDVENISVSDGRVFVSHWTYLDLFDTKTGRHLMTFGIW